MTKHFLTIEGGKLVRYTNNSDDAIDVPNLEALTKLFVPGETDVLVSSSIDFPTEYTSDPAVLALVNVLRES